MGLIRAAISAVGGTMADQWKEFFICESLDADVLAVKGQKRIGSRSANKKEVIILSQVGRELQWQTDSVL